MRTQVVLDERDIGGQTRDALVHILEGLQVRQMYHHEERLLERIVNFCRLTEFY